MVSDLSFLTYCCSRLIAFRKRVKKIGEVDIICLDGIVQWEGISSEEKGDGVLGTEKRFELK